MKRLNYLLFTLALTGFVAVGCEKGGDKGDKQIELPDKSQQTQQAYADEENTGGGFTFVAKSAWTATVEETTPAPTARSGGNAAEVGAAATRAATVPWLRLLMGGQETYSGAAGEITLAIELEPNYSGSKRSASITIACGGTSITITVAQEGTTVDNKVPKGRLDPHELTLYVGESATLSVTDPNGAMQFPSCRSLDPAIAKISPDRVVTAVSPGQTYIVLDLLGVSPGFDGSNTYKNADMCRVIVLPAKDDQKPSPQTLTVEGPIMGNAGEGIAQVRALKYDDESVIATGTFSYKPAPARFSVTLPEVNASALTSFGLPSGVTVSNPAVKQTHVNELKLYTSDGTKCGELECEGILTPANHPGLTKNGEMEIESYIYVDMDCDITGKATTNEDPYESLTYNAHLKRGWNILYGLDKGNGNYELTTTKPAGEMVWEISWYKNTGNDDNTDKRLIGSISEYQYIDYEGNPNPGSGISSQINKYEFTYDGQTRVTNVKFTDHYGKIYTTGLSYPDASTMVYVNSVPAGEDGGGTYTAKLNADGSIARMSGSGNDDETLTYSGGYLQKSTHRIATGYNTAPSENGTITGGTATTHEGTATTTFTWSGGNLVSIAEKGEFPTDPGSNWTYSYEFSYGGTANPATSIDLGSLFIEGVIGNSARGWFGKSSANLPTTIKRTERYSSNSQVYTTVYRYELDGDGYPVKIYERKKRENGTWLYDERLCRTITYITR